MTDDIAFMPATRLLAFYRSRQLSPLQVISTHGVGGRTRWAQKGEAVALMDPGLVEVCRRGEAVTREQYVEAVAQRAALGQRLRLFFDRYDLLLSPTMPSRRPMPTRAPTSCRTQAMCGAG